MYVNQPLLTRVSSYCDPLRDLFFKNNIGQVVREHLHTNHNNNLAVAPLTVTRTHTPTPVAPVLPSVGYVNGDPDSHTLVNYLPPAVVRSTQL